MEPRPGLTSENGLQNSLGRSCVQACCQNPPCPCHGGRGGLPEGTWGTGAASSWLQHGCPSSTRLGPDQTAVHSPSADCLSAAPPPQPANMSHTLKILCTICSCHANSPCQLSTENVAAVQCITPCCMLQRGQHNIMLYMSVTSRMSVQGC